MSPERPKISLRSLSAWIGETPVLRGVDLDVPARGVTAVIGPSGSGKSTLVRCINRMHELIPGARTSGQISLDGRDIQAAEVDPVLLRRRIGMVFREPNPFPSMSIRDNVLAGLRLTGQRLGRAREQVVLERALHQAALWGEVRGRLDERGRGLSAGQQQRLCIARALAVEPEVVLLDEPCATLDPLATAEIEDLLHELRQHYTVVLATHDLHQAARVAQRTAFLLDGELIEQGETDRMFTAPEDRRTEDYITGKFG
ncbi:phosphate ABC transporter ATP-binding protein [Nannocystaceae bacterium ST9]